MPSMRQRLRGKLSEHKKLVGSTGASSSNSSPVPRKRGRPFSRGAQDEGPTVPPLPSFRKFDPKVACPLLSSVLTRCLETTPMTASELHQMQQEAESLLSHTAVRYKQLLQFYQQLNGKAVAVPPSASRLENRLADQCNGLPAKVKNYATSSVEVAGHSASSAEECRPGPSRAPGSQVSPTSSRFYQYSNNTAPDRFWAFVKEYLRTPSDEDMIFLKKLIDDCDPDKASVGSYASKSAVAGRAEEAPSCSGTAYARSKVRESVSPNGGDWYLRRRSIVYREEQTAQEAVAGATGPSASDMNGCIPLSKSGSAKFLPNSCCSRPDRPVTRRQALGEDVLDGRKGEGTLDGELAVDAVDAVDDEVMLELVERQAELRLLQTANYCTLLRLRRMAEEVRRCEVHKDSLRQVEDALVDVARRFNTPSAVAAELNKKEEEHVWKLLREWQRLKDEIGRS